MKIIFLDIDGVLNSVLYEEVKHAKKINSMECLGKPLANIDPANLNILQVLVKKTNASIVISSTWRKDPLYINKEASTEERINFFKDIFNQLGFKNAPIIGITPNLYSLRGHEVAEFLDEITKKEQIDDYIILDDDSDFICNELSDLKSSILDRMHLLEKCEQEKKSKYWKNQKLFIVNKLTGLSYSDLITILKLWQPNDELLKINEEYLPYLKNYGKKFK